MAFNIFEVLNYKLPVVEHCFDNYMSCAVSGFHSCEKLKVATLRSLTKDGYLTICCFMSREAYMVLLFSLVEIKLVKITLQKFGDATIASDIR